MDILELSAVLIGDRFEFAKSSPHDLPWSAGIYAIFEGEKLLYIGQTSGLQSRVWKTHLIGPGPSGQGSAFRDYLTQDLKLRQVIPTNVPQNAHRHDSKWARFVYEFILQRCSYSFVQLADGDRSSRSRIEKQLVLRLRPAFNRIR